MGSDGFDEGDEVGAGVDGEGDGVVAAWFPCGGGVEGTEAVAEVEPAETEFAVAKGDFGVHFLGGEGAAGEGCGVESAADVEGVGLAERAVDFEIGFGDGLGFGCAVGESEAVEELEDLVSAAAAFAVDGGLLFLPCFFFGAAWFGASGGFSEDDVAACGETETADDAVGFGEFDAAALDDDAGAEVADGDPFAALVFGVDGHADVGVVEGDGAEEVAFVDEFGDIDVEADAVDVDEWLVLVEEVEDADISGGEAVDWVEGEAADFCAEAEGFEFAFDGFAPAAVEADVVGVEGEGGEAADEEEREVEAETAAADAHTHGEDGGWEGRVCQGRR